VRRSNSLSPKQIKFEGKKLLESHAFWLRMRKSE
jgi:hypothetical protein